MNRIYQGRVSTVEILQPGTSGRTADYVPLNAEAKVARAAGEKLLWEHHRLVQDAGDDCHAAVTVRLNGRSSTLQSRVSAPPPAPHEIGKSSYVPAWLGRMRQGIVDVWWTRRRFGDIVHPPMWHPSPILRHWTRAGERLRRSSITIRATSFLIDQPFRLISPQNLPED